MATLPRRILLVDDDEAMREMLTWLLEMEGYTVASAATGADAIALLTGSQCAPDVLLLDFDLPDMTAREVRAAQRT